MRIRLGVAAVCLAALAAGGRPAAFTPKPLTRGDLRWLARVTCGLDSTSVARFRQLGRERFLDEQLHPPAADPPELARAVAAVPVIQQTAEQRVKAFVAEQRRINALPTDDEKQRPRMALNQAGNQAIYETTKRHLMRTLLSPSQLREQMTWFWMNHVICSRSCEGDSSVRIRWRFVVS